MSTRISQFMETHFRHFNSASLLRAARAYSDHVGRGGRMLLAMAGAMSTAELGISLARMIRGGKLHAISCTGANLEEDLFNLVANRHYKKIPEYRDLTPDNEASLADRGLNRVTDVCIPEDYAMRKLERHLSSLWVEMDRANERLFPYECFYRLIRSGALADDYEIDIENSWVVAACERNLPIFTPGWEDSTIGNNFVAEVRRGTVSSLHLIRSGLEQMDRLIDWYKENNERQSIGFFQIGGGIAGDFPICVVPLIKRDLRHDCKPWGYYCQISDSTTSYGSYSGAVPNEKITWGKISPDTPRFIIESDATIVAPLLFAYVLEQDDC